MLRRVPEVSLTKVPASPGAGAKERQAAWRDQERAVREDRERFLDRLGRPIDLCVRDGKLYVVEYCRQTETVGPGSAGYGAGGRVLGTRQF